MEGRSYAKQKLAGKEYNLLDEWDPTNGTYQGAPWFFEKPKPKEETKDDSFTRINFQNVYEMEGTAPHDEASNLIGDGEGYSQAT